MSQNAPVEPIAVRHPGGNGAPLMMIHGYGADMRTFAANQPALSAVADVWMVDLPGHGQSSSDVGDGSVTTLTRAVAARMDANGLAAADIVGHSLGGAVAIRLAHLRPDLVGSLTLLSPAGVSADLDEGFVFTLPTLTDRETAEWLFRRLVVRPNLINKTMITYVLGELEKPGRRQALQRIAVAMRGLHGEMQPACRVVGERGIPRLTIWGERDRVNRLYPDALAAFGGETLILPDVGHVPHAEAAVAVNRAIIAFLGKLRTSHAA